MHKIWLDAQEGWGRKIKLNVALKLAFASLRN